MKNKKGEPIQTPRDVLRRYLAGSTLKIRSNKTGYVEARKKEK